METLQPCDVPDRVPWNMNTAGLNRRLTQYLANRAAGHASLTQIQSNVTSRPLTPQEREAREARMRDRAKKPAEKGQPAYSYRRSSAEAYQPKRPAAAAPTESLTSPPPPDVPDPVPAPVPNPEPAARSKPALEALREKIHAKRRPSARVDGAKVHRPRTFARKPQPKRKPRRAPTPDLTRDLGGMILRWIGL